ncbi:MAG TPA: hypothetical protein VF045_11475 [Acidimicrobiales bacterium]
MFTLRSRAVALAAMAATLVVVPSAGVSAAPAVDLADFVQVFNRDVFEVYGPNLLNPDAGTDPAAPLFSNAGVALDLSWGEWSAAAATSAARVMGGSAHARTDFRIDLAGLVPGGLYSVFWGTLGPDSEQPLCPGVERTLPLDRVGGGGGLDPNSFRAGTDGAATYRGRTAGDLFEAQQVFISIVYRLYEDPSSYPFPNLGELLTQGDNCRSSFGEDAMRQLLIFQKF